MANVSLNMKTAAVKEIGALAVSEINSDNYIFIKMNKSRASRDIFRVEL